jgi:hypothetical protein
MVQDGWISVPHPMVRGHALFSQFFREGLYSQMWHWNLVLWPTFSLSRVAQLELHLQHGLQTLWFESSSSPDGAGAQIYSDPSEFHSITGWPPYISGFGYIITLCPSQEMYFQTLHGVVDALCI